MEKTMSELTDGKADAESDVGDGVDAAVDRDMSEVDQVTHDWHHCRIYHANGYTPPGVRR